MYRYRPNGERKLEKRLVLFLLIFCVICFACAGIPGVFLPAALQILGVCCLFGAVILLLRYLLRSYCYAVEAREDGVTGDLWDLVITERYCNRTSVVCRISLSEVEQIEDITPQSRKEIARRTKHARVYSYIGELLPADARLLTLHGEDGCIYLKIQANDALIAAIEQRTMK
ncbi:MAG: hypothetical protein IKB75_00755 [Clostridia bacterium]|nr:hypothetical protein [Clostridia bacterium]